MRPRKEPKYVPDGIRDVCRTCTHDGVWNALPYGKYPAELRKKCDRCEDGSKYTYWGFKQAKRNRWRRLHERKGQVTLEYWRNNTYKRLPF